MDNGNVFGAWLTEQQKKRGLSDTKLAAALDTTAATIGRWRAGSVKPRDSEVLDAVADFFGEDRGKVYTIAGRGYVGADSEGLDPRFAEIAFALQTAFRSGPDMPAVQEYFFDIIKRKMREGVDEFEAVKDLLVNMGKMQT